MSRTMVGALVVLGTLSLLPRQAAADQRSYVWTYEAQTVPKGDAELEYYYTIAAPDSSHMKTNVTTEQKLEYEVGMSERLDFAIYQVFEQPPEGDLRYEAFQLRWRYRLGEKGDGLVDSLVYLEYEGVPDFSEHVVELKWVAAKDIGRFNISVNPILEMEFGDETEVEPEYACGVSYKANPLLRLGVEAKGGENGHYIGPVISHGKGRFWATLGSAFAVGNIDDDKPEFQARLLLGIGL